MAETEITVTEIAQPYLAESTTPQLTTVAFTASDNVNGNVIKMGGRDIILLATGTGTITITSSNDPYGRTADITAFSVTGLIVARRFTPTGWERSTGSGELIITTSAATVTILAIRL